MDAPAYRIAIAIAKAVSWLFTSLPGLVVLAIAAFLLLLLRMGRAARADRSLRKAAGEKIGPFAGAEAALSEAASLAVKAAMNIPSLLMTVALLSVVAVLSTTVTRFDSFLRTQERIKGYEKVVSNLERRYRFATVECLSADGSSFTARVDFWDAAGKSVASSQEVSFPGIELFLDAVVLNFAYAGIESGKARNLAFPRAAFSDRVAERDGVSLKAADSAGLPWLFRRDETEIYGLGKDEFDERLGEILSMAKDEATARKAGVVRSLYGSAVHRTMRRGTSFTVWIEQSGGLTVKESDF